MATANWPKTLQEAVIYFSNPDTCFQAAIRMRWSGGPVACPTCGSTNVHFIATRQLWRCKGEKHARQQFSVRIGTVMEDSPISLDKWMVAMWLLASAKNGISSYELGRAIGISQKSAWFLLHRIRLAMQATNGGKLGGSVEADETFIGGRARNMHAGRKARVLKGRASGTVGKMAVMGLLQRNSPDGHSKVVTAIVPNVRRYPLQMQIRKHVKTGSTLYTDALRSYETPAAWGPQDLYVHKVIDHAERYVDGEIHTNSMENFWSLLKRTIRGTYVSVEPFHLFRYLDEQTFRFNSRKMTDSERFEATGRMIVGKRLTFNALTGRDLSESRTN
jgi:transposase-like protein